jgi:hypothetical protein
LRKIISERQEKLRVWHARSSNEACWDGFERWLAAASYYQELWDLPGKQKLWASEEYSTYLLRGIYMQHL